MTIHYFLCIDGASRGNPGPGAAAAVVRNGGEQTLAEHGWFLGLTTNNVAEYTGLVRGLEAVKALAGAAKAAGASVLVRSDSELLVKQMRGEYRIKNAKLKPLAIRAQALRREFREVTFEHVPREQNGEADALANRAMDLGADV